MNRVILMGRLTRDPEIRYSQNSSEQMAIARFTLAVDRRVRRDAEVTADFINCVAFGRTADFMGKYTHQGTKLCVEGRIQTGSYVKQDGSKVYTTDVVIDNAEFAESKAAETGRSSGMPQGQNQWQGQNQNQNPWQSPNQNQWQSQNQNQNPWPGQAREQYQQPVQNPSANGPAFGGQQDNGSQELQDEGFMAIPDAVDDEGLPFG